MSALHGVMSCCHSGMTTLQVAMKRCLSVTERDAAFATPEAAHTAHVAFPAACKRALKHVPFLAPIVPIYSTRPQMVRA
jgi:hypothetical protein